MPSFEGFPGSESHERVPDIRLHETVSAIIDARAGIEDDFEENVDPDEYWSYSADDTSTVHSRLIEEFDDDLGTVGLSIVSERNFRGIESFRFYLEEANLFLHYVEGLKGKDVLSQDLEAIVDVGNDLTQGLFLYFENERMNREQDEQAVDEVISLVRHALPLQNSLKALGVDQMELPNEVHSGSSVLESLGDIHIFADAKYLKEYAELRVHPLLNSGLSDEEVYLFREWEFFGEDAFERLDRRFDEINHAEDRDKGVEAILDYLPQSVDLFADQVDYSLYRVQNAHEEARINKEELEERLQFVDALKRRLEDLRHRISSEG